MKEALIIFVMALVIGSVLNSLQTSENEGAAIASAIPAVTDSNFKNEVLQSDKPVLVDFYANWCAPCKRMAPVVDQLAKQYDGKLKVVRLNIDENREVAELYQIESIPRFYFFKDGKLVGRITGAAPKDDLVAAIEKAEQTAQ